MGFSSPSPGFLPSQLRGKREAFQFERILRGLCFILDEWCRYTGARKPLYGETDSSSLGVIYFDKLALLVFRLWNGIFEQHKPKIWSDAILTEADVQRLVTFPSPFIELPGKHGRGPARLADSSPPEYIVGSLYALQQEGIPYFEITLPDLTASPNDHRSTIRAGLHSNSSEFLAGFTAREIEVLTDIAHAVRRLGASEIRALGTHENHRKTVEDINKEFRDMEHSRRALIEMLEGDKPLTRECDNLLEYADEAWRKSFENRRDYEDAFNIMLQELNDVELRTVFSKCQSPKALIWDETDMPVLVKRAGIARAGALYLKGISLYQSDPTKHSSQSKSNAAKRFRAIWKDAVEATHQHCNGRLPGAIEDVFERGTASISVPVKKTLIEVIGEVGI